MVSIILDSALIIFAFASPYLLLAIGRRAYDCVRYLFPSKQATLSDTDNSDQAVLFVLGLLVYLWLLYFLKLAGLPWWCATFLPFVVLCLPPRSFSKTIKPLNITTSFNFVAWFFVIISIGLTLFIAGSDIKTVWKNNYGDVTFHIGMISSFALGDNFPPHYHLFAGETLSYPFFINLWSASYWWLSSSYHSLSLIFAFQWSVIWFAIFFLLRGHRNTLLPWALLLAGGSYYHLGNNGGALISEGHPWTDFLSTVWVTQRGALLGVATLIAACKLIFDGVAKESPSAPRQIGAQRVVLAGLILGMSPLVHTHTTLSGMLFLGALLILRLLSTVTEDYWKAHWKVIAALGGAGFVLLLSLAGPAADLPVIGALFAAIRSAVFAVAKGPGVFLGKAGLAFFWILFAYLLSLVVVLVIERSLVSDTNRDSKRSLQTGESDLWYFILSLSPAFLALPWIVGKTGMIKPVLGWTSGKYEALEGFARVAATLKVWHQDIWVWPFLILLLWFFTRWHRFFIVLTVCIIGANVLQLAVWSWDQLKIFIGFYSIFIVFWSCLPARYTRLYQLLVVALIIPGLYEAFVLFNKGEMFTVYTAEKVAHAWQARERLPVDAIVAAKPDHNSAITLTGRTLFYGYEGTLHSHAIDYQRRRKVFMDLEALSMCQQKLPEVAQHCPQFVLWAAEEKDYWKVDAPGSQYKKVEGPFYQIETNE